MQKKESLWNKVIPEYWNVILLIILVIVFSQMSPIFISLGNLVNILRSLPILGIATLGVAMLIITGSIDLSCGAIATCSGTVAAWLAVKGWHPLVCIGSAIFTGAICGLMNGLLITNFELKPFIVTMGSSYLIRGLTQMLTNGTFISGLPPWFYKISNTNIIGNFIYSNFLIFLVLAGVVFFIMKYTIFGRYCYAVGFSNKASELAGINVKKHLCKVYFFEGALAGIAGIILMSYLNVGAPSEAMGLEAYAIAAVIIGGIRFDGGDGGIGRAIIGLITIEIFKNGVAIIGMNTYGQQAVTGLLIIVAIIIDYFRKKSKEDSYEE